MSQKTQTHHKTLGRIAACTAVALAAGTLLAGPASAAGDRPDRGFDTTEHLGPQQQVVQPGPLPEAAAPRGTFAAAAGARTAPRFDADGDGKADVLYRAIDGRYFVNPGSGSSPFTYKVGRPATNFEYKDVIPVGNLTGDKSTELLTLSPDGALTLYPGAGRTGTSTTARWSGRGWTMYNKIIAPGDLTGDGKADLLARTHSGVLYLYPSTGNASDPFKAPVKVGAGWQAFDQLVGAGDTDGDGRADLVVRTPGGDLYRYPGTGKASEPFGARKKVGFGYQTYNQLVGVDDRNGDGLGDLMARTVGGSAYLYHSDGKGGFKARSYAGDRWNVSTNFAAQGAVPGFGRNDLVGRDGAGTLWWYFSKNNGTLGARQKLSKDGGWLGANVNYVSSLDNDSDGDLVEIWNGHLFKEATDMGAGWGVYNALAGVGDLSGDGRGDLLARDRSGNLYLYKTQGGKLAPRIKVGAGWGGYNKLAGAGDMTGDGRADLVARDGRGNLYLYPGTGNAKAPFAGRVKIGTGYGAYRQLVVTGDLNGDSRADLVATDSSGNLWRYTSYGSGKLTARAKIGTGYQIYGNLY
ncbi:VCBS repeat-containing protein [Streptomyces bambusae]|uniref:FG-GAP repeat domain-containing protein n=1 Tax=Streptomyces bambusae TaxID=1550616 RepID=UPI001CFE1DBB|nr:VCBS repeat-containing protein [Streptomyces bambusae]MCB5167923.1 VCBS repeat-containing protein [Streptomyces bambusae]